MLNACDKLGESDNFLTQSCLMPLVYESFSYLKRVEQHLFLHLFQLVSKLTYRYTCCVLIAVSVWTLLRSQSCSEISKHKLLLKSLMQDEMACMSLNRACFMSG